MTSPEREPLAYRMFGATVGAIVLFVMEVVQILVIALAIILPVRWFLIMPFIVKGQSMEPAFHNNDYLIVDELSYRLHPIVRGDVVVFIPTVDPSEFYIKRVIGLPGEKISINDGVITIKNTEFPNGFDVKESYIDEYTYGKVSNLVLADDEYFVLGDNRDNSSDSRRIGAVKKEAIVGRVWLRGLPLDQFGPIVTPTYDVVNN